MNTTRKLVAHGAAAITFLAAFGMISAATAHADLGTDPQPDPADAVDATMPSTTIPEAAPDATYPPVVVAPPASVPVIGPPATYAPNEPRPAVTASASCAGGLVVQVANFPIGSGIIISDAGLGVNQLVLRGSFSGSRSFRVPNPDKGRPHDWLIGTTPIGVQQMHVHLEETCAPKVGPDPTKSPVINPDDPDATDQTDPTGGADPTAVPAPVTKTATPAKAAAKTHAEPKADDSAATPAAVVQVDEPAVDEDTAAAAGRSPNTSILLRFGRW